jgi:hypothetical protein
MAMKRLLAAWMEFQRSAGASFTLRRGAETSGNRRELVKKLWKDEEGQAEHFVQQVRGQPYKP